MINKEAITDRVTKQIKEMSIGWAMENADIVEELFLYSHGQRAATDDARRRLILFIIQMIDDAGMTIVNREK